MCLHPFCIFQRSIVFQFKKIWKRVKVNGIQGDSIHWPRECESGMLTIRLRWYYRIVNVIFFERYQSKLWGDIRPRCKQPRGKCTSTRSLATLSDSQIGIFRGIREHIEAISHFSSFHFNKCQQRISGSCHMDINSFPPVFSELSISGSCTFHLKACSGASIYIYIGPGVRIWT